MNSAIAGYAQAGRNVIVDYIAYKKEWLDDMIRFIALLSMILSYKLSKKALKC